jgi:hypothetical protein
MLGFVFESHVAGDKLVDFFSVCTLQAAAAAAQGHDHYIGVRALASARAGHDLRDRKTSTNVFSSRNLPTDAPASVAGTAASVDGSSTGPGAIVPGSRASVSDVGGGDAGSQGSSDSEVVFGKVLSLTV